MVNKEKKYKLDIVWPYFWHWYIKWIIPVDNKKMKKERVDKTKNKIKVIKELLRNPLQTDREIAKNANIWLATTNRNKKEVEQNGTKSNIIDEIIKKDAEIVQLAQDELQKRIKENPSKVSTRDIISAGDVSAKRYSIFKWDATDKEWWLKSISDINIVIWN